MPIINKPNQHFDATLYTGNGANRSITNAGGFSPDLVWGQARSAAYGSWLFDSVRGATKQISSFSGNAESTQATMLTAFNSDGFSMGTDTAGNESSTTYVGWQWKAGGASTVNTSGTISSNVSVNTTAGFSVVTYTGTGSNATVGHGLGVAPKMLIVKNRGVSTAWRVWFTGFAGTEQLNLNETVAKETGQTTWNSTVPSNTVFSLGTTNSANASANTYVAYCFAEVEGYSKFGSYTGNGSADGPFVYTGFRPKFIMVKSSSSVTDWNMWDTSRSPYNQGGQTLWANLSNAEYTAAVFYDILSNGFKLRDTNAESNANTQTYIYMAFAEAPFKYSNAR